MTEKINPNILNSEWKNTVEKKDLFIGKKARAKINGWTSSLKGILMTPKQKEAKKIENEINIEKDRMVKIYNGYPQETKDEIKQGLRDLYENYERWRLADFDVGDYPNHYKYIRPKKSLNQDYINFFGMLFNDIDPFKSSYEEIKRQTKLINRVIKEIISKEEKDKIYNEVWGSSED